MPNNNLLKLDGIESGSTVSGHENEIEIQSWNWKTIKHGWVSSLYKKLTFRKKQCQQVEFTHKLEAGSSIFENLFKSKKKISAVTATIYNSDATIAIKCVKNFRNIKVENVASPVQLIFRNVRVEKPIEEVSSGSKMEKVTLSFESQEIQFFFYDSQAFLNFKKMYFCPKIQSEIETFNPHNGSALPMDLHWLILRKIKVTNLICPPRNDPEKMSQVVLSFKIGELKKPVVTSFCGVNFSYPVFRDERDFIKSRREKMGLPVGSLDYSPTAKNQLVGLCLSGGGIRSATFCLGFIQALFSSRLLKRVDYLSTVSGGGYIGSCLTALLSSDIENIDKEIKKSSKKKKIPPLWDECNFPFARPKLQEKDDILPDNSRLSNECSLGIEKPVTAEKEPVRRLRYYSNYITAEGNFVKKYFGPVLAFGRGFVFNLSLIIPLPILVAVLLALLYGIPDFNIQFPGFGPIRSHLQMGRMDTNLRNRLEAVQMYEQFILNESKNFSFNLTFSERVEIIKANPSLAKREDSLSTKISILKESIWKEWIGMLILPGIAVLFVLAVDLVFMGTKKFSLISCRFKFSYYSSICLLLSFLVPLIIQLFGAAIVYWNVYKLPNEVAFMALLSLIGPKLLGNVKIGDKDSAFWGKIVLPVCLMLLAPALLLYFTGLMVHLIRKWNLGFMWLIAGGFLILWLPSRLININKISLHRFYRDRLSRAFQIQHDHKNPIQKAMPFQRVSPNDRIDLTKLYENDGTIGPYHIINTNLNQTKELPMNNRDGVFRTGENFIFSKHFCGSRITGYIRTDEYQKLDKHINLATAVAISGAAVNIGMGSGNMPVLRLLMALLNIRLGYWAPDPSSINSTFKRILFGKAPGTWTLYKEMLGVYSKNSSYINLSDGGHFDNLGVYEMLRRRCKYIIVADAEADPLMKFQGLAYIIRLARIDFGINIEIDISDLKLDKATNVSKNHCVVGTIKYPDDSEFGYLFYCKSSVTGDLPQHLYEYRVKHPTFPHQTTADQWFDEQQFEVYRELGYHVGRECVKPVTSLLNSKIDDKMSTEDVFVQLKQHWYPSPPGMEERSTRYANELDRIIEHIKNDQNLRFIDAQIYPEWKFLMHDNGEPLYINLWLPKNRDQIRAGFYVCNLMIQLMENVYIDLNLDQTYNHPSNRGWMNLFMHWAWSGMFRITWAITACTFSGEFQRFCERHLRLNLGDIEAKQILSEKDMKFDKDAENIFRVSAQMKEKLSTHLNPFEIIKIDKFLHDQKMKTDCLPERCYSFNMAIINPLDEKQTKNFTFGFSLIRFSADSTEILYFRIQDHLRCIGLGRLALGKLVDKLVDNLTEKFKISGYTKSKAENLRFIKLGESSEDSEERGSFTKLLNSVKAEKNINT
jgi:type VI protein secretion system component Hcp